MTKYLFLVILFLSGISLNASEKFGSTFTELEPSYPLALKGYFTEKPKAKYVTYQFVIEEVVKGEFSGNIAKILMPHYYDFSHIKPQKSNPTFLISITNHHFTSTSKISVQNFLIVFPSHSII